VQVSVLCTGAAKAAMLELQPQFERMSGHALTLSFNTTGIVFDRIARGEALDVVISARTSIEELLRLGHLVADSVVEIARTGVGIVVAQGRPKPDISSAETFRAVLIGAHSVAYTNPASGGASGVHVARMLQRLGIADEINAKAVFGDGGPIAHIVARGGADLGIHQIPELLGHAGVDYVGPLPAELQSYTHVAAAIPWRATSRDGATALIGFLGSSDALAIMRAKGMER
jgi:molybdate transport system substrate-binding protein